jgi:hypothetical protein
MDLMEIIFTELNNKGGWAQTIFYILVGVSIGYFIGMTMIHFVFGYGW